MRTIYIILGITLLSAACKKPGSKKPMEEQQSKYDYFIFGTSYGMCAVNCTRIYKIEDGKMYEDNMEHFMGKGYTFSNTPVTQNKYQQAMYLATILPQYLKNHPDSTFGCPDCHDQGAIHVEVKQNGVVTRWQMDTDDKEIPAEIRSFASEIVKTANNL